MKGNPDPSLAGSTESTREDGRSSGDIKMGRRIVIIALIPVCLIACWGLVPSARQQVHQRFEEYRLSGAPVLPGDMLAELADADPSTLSWLNEFDALPRHWRHKGFPDLSSENFPLARELAASDPDGLAHLEAWHDCLHQDPAVGSIFAWHAMDDFLDSYPNVTTITECEMHALRLRLESTGKKRIWADRILEHGPVDVRKLVEDIVQGTVDANDNPYPDIPYERLSGIVALNVDVATFAAIEGRIEDFLRSMKLALRAIELGHETHWFRPHSIRLQSTIRFLDALERTLSWLPHGTDLSFIELFIEEQNPREDTLRALRGNRAFANLIYQRLRNGEFDPGGRLPPGEGMMRYIRGRSVYQSQLEFLDLMDLHLGWLDQPVNGPLPDSFRTLETRMGEVRRGFELLRSLPIFVPHESRVLRLREAEVSLVLAAYALRAHREGIEAVLPEIRTEIDPCSGGTLLAKVEPNGDWMIWSVGRDGIDQGGSSLLKGLEPEDIVWRYKPAR